MPAWLNLANLITLARLALVPLIIGDIIRGEHLRALELFFVAAVSDALDGALARGRSGVTPFGAYLDPIADKCLMSGVYLAFWASGLVPGWFVGIVFGRDIFILLGALAAVALTNVRKFPPSRWGKLSTFVQIVTAICWMTRNVWPGAVLDAIASAMLYICTAFTVASGLDYLRRGMHLFRAR